MILELLKNLIWERSCSSTIIQLLHIIIRSILVSVSQLDRISRHNDAHGSIGRNLSLSLLTTFGGYEDYTVGTTHTEYGCGWCILQYGNALDFAWVDVVEVTLYTIHLNQWRWIVGSSLSTYQDSCSISSRLTGILYRRKTWNYTRKHIVDGTGRNLGQLATIDIRDRTRYSYLLLYTVSHNLYIFQHLGIVLKSDSKGTTTHLYSLWLAAYVSNLQGLSTFGIDLEVTIYIGNSRNLSANYTYGSTYDRFSRCVFYYTFHIIALQNSLDAVLNSQQLLWQQSQPSRHCHHEKEASWRSFQIDFFH